MEASTVDPPQLAAREPAPPPSAPAPSAPAPAALRCANCNAPLADGQDWCLQCGAGAPGSLHDGGWRPAAAVLAVALALVLGAAAAGYAALNSHAPKARVLTTTAPEAAAPAPVTPTTTAPGTTGTPTTTIPPIASKPPKIPLTAVTPKPGAIAIPKTTLPKLKLKLPTTPATTTPTTTPSAGEAPSSSALVLDTDAAGTYNPYAFPATGFGDPSLAIDGDSSTGWTAQVQPSSAPKMAEGLLIDLKTARKLAAVTLATSTPGMTIQIYGANGATPPASITDPAWKTLTHSIVVHKRHIRLKLRPATVAFRYLTVWVSSAPSSAVGTPEAPGHVSINELELFPA
ncbi:MAG TPA: hypothetical protein VFW29_08310 [Solirubrobacteraceae bacterium]|nr:hypothetical protein [Solirubrobacteraceae bacterium]